MIVTKRTSNASKSKHRRVAQNYQHVLEDISNSSGVSRRASANVNSNNKQSQNSKRIPAPGKEN